MHLDLNLYFFDLSMKDVENLNAVVHFVMVDWSNIYKALKCIGFNGFQLIVEQFKIT